MTLKSKLSTFQSVKDKLDGMANHIEVSDAHCTISLQSSQLKRVCRQVQSGRTEKTIREEFQKLYRFLRAEETKRIDALRKEAAEKSKSMKEKIAAITCDVSTVSQNIDTVEKELRAKDVPFMQVLDSHLSLVQAGQFYGSEALIDVCVC